MEWKENESKRCNHISNNPYFMYYIVADKLSWIWWTTYIQHIPYTIYHIHKIEMIWKWFSFEWQLQLHYINFSLISSLNNNNMYHKLGESEHLNCPIHLFLPLFWCKNNMNIYNIQCLKSDLLNDSTLSSVWNWKSKQIKANNIYWINDSRNEEMALSTSKTNCKMWNNSKWNKKK